MRFIGSKLGTRISALCLSFILILVAAFPVQATDTIKDLEDKTSGLQSDLSKLKKELNALDNELNNILSQIEKTSESLEKTNFDA